MARRFQLHLVTDRKQSRGDPVGVSAAALCGGVDWVQVRQKSGPALELYENVSRILPYAREAGAGVTVNDRVDVALAAGACGVHLAGKSLPTAVARNLFGGLLGVSVHSLEEALIAADGGVDYVTFGHVYPTSSKPGLPPRGIRELARIVDSIKVPVIAIGGIDASNVGEVLKTGASGVAIISAVTAAEDPEKEARKLREKLDASPSFPRYPFPQPLQKGTS